MLIKIAKNQGQNIKAETSFLIGHNITKEEDLEQLIIDTAFQMNSEENEHNLDTFLTTKI